ncbi:MAG: hypothetical protein WA294_03705 [Acidobacteriaceae bacterium]
MRRAIFITGSILLLGAAVSWAIPSIVADPVRFDLNAGRADAALQTLNPALSQNPADAEALNLRCRVFYEEQLWNQAIADCESAVKAAPADSDFHLWLGRAYGQKAAHISMVSAFKLARKVAAEFQQAVQLDPRNAAALSDMGEFDVDAPGMVGGGINRALAIVPQLQSISPAAALALQARIAEAQKNYPEAESDLKAAISQSSYPSSAWMDLASFYRRRGRLDEMVSTVHTGAALDHSHGPALVDGASNLSAAHREPQTAVQLLQLYLASRAQTEDAPAFIVRAQLAHLLADEGDAADAQQQLAVAHTLASAWHIPSGRRADRAAQ